jgi:hypothetical protein
MRIAFDPLAGHSLFQNRVPFLFGQPEAMYRNPFITGGGVISEERVAQAGDSESPRYPLVWQHQVSFASKPAM